MDGTNGITGGWGTRDGDYRVFVLRLWHETGGEVGAAVWRRSLEERRPGSGAVSQARSSSPAL